MSDESVGGPVGRDVGRPWHWTDHATREELANYCRHAEDDLRAKAAELDRLREALERCYDAAQDGPGLTVGEQHKIVQMLQPNAGSNRRP